MAKDDFDPQKVALGRRIREARERQKLTQGQLAKRLNLKTKQAVSHWEVGRWCPEASLLPLLARELDCSVDWLLNIVRNPGGTRDPTKQIPHFSTDHLIAYAQGKLGPASIHARRPTLADSEDLISIDANRAMQRQDGSGIAAGSKLTIDVSRKPEPGEIVLVVLLASGEALLGRYRPGPTRRPGEFVVRADNDDYGERIISKSDRAKIVGTVVEIISLRSR